MASSVIRAGSEETEIEIFGRRQRARGGWWQLLPSGLASEERSSSFSILLEEASLLRGFGTGLGLCSLGYLRLTLWDRGTTGENTILKCTLTQKYSSETLLFETKVFNVWFCCVMLLYKTFSLHGASIPMLLSQCDKVAPCMLAT